MILFHRKIGKHHKYNIQTFNSLTITTNKKSDTVILFHKNYKITIFSVYFVGVVFVRRRLLFLLYYYEKM